MLRVRKDHQIQVQDNRFIHSCTSRHITITFLPWKRNKYNLYKITIQYIKLWQDTSQIHPHNHINTNMPPVLTCPHSLTYNTLTPVLTFTPVHAFTLYSHFTHTSLTVYSHIHTHILLTVYSHIHTHTLLTVYSYIHTLLTLYSHTMPTHITCSHIHACSHT